MTARLREWLAGLGERERRVTATGALVAVAVAALAILDVARTRHDALTRRIVAHERELVQVRALAATMPAGADDAGPGALARLQSAADATGVADRVAGLAGTDADGRVTLRVAGASLPETIALLHALDRDRPAPPVAHFSLEKHADDPTRFDVVLEVVGR